MMTQVDDILHDIVRDVYACMNVLCGCRLVCCVRGRAATIKNLYKFCQFHFN